ncbi:hypothetical protein EHM82_04435, partial [bacterium]
METLRGWALLLSMLAVVALGYLGYRVWESRSLEWEAARVLAEDRDLIQRLQNEERARSFGSEYKTALESFQEAESLHDAEDYKGSIEKGRWSYNVLRSILDALALPGGAAGQAQFVNVQGEVEYRRSAGGEWVEARSRVSLHPGDFVRTSDRGSAEIMFQDGTL